MFGARHCPGAEAIMAVLRALGAEIDGEGDVDDAIEARRRQLWRRLAEPVCVVRRGSDGARRDADGVRGGTGAAPYGSGALRLRPPSRHADGRIRCRAVGEDGEVRTWETRLDEISPLAGGSAGGDDYVLKHVPLPQDLPIGYHRCAVDVAGDRAETLIISAPDGAATPQQLGRPHGWGAFVPLYALRAGNDWGVGDYNDLAALADWIADFGGDTLATLPLLPTDSSALSGPSPYSPVSRLFWSELFVDLSAVPELHRCASAERPSLSEGAHPPIDALGGSEQVKYAEIAALKRTLLIEMAEVLFSPVSGDGDRRARLGRFVERHPEVDTYARFRAALQRHGRPWSDWPAPMRAGEIREGDFDEAVYRSHLIGQWLAHEQLGEVADDMRRRGMQLYLDLPLGVPHDSFDVWRYREQFADGATAGAPPDTFFMQGQDWGLPPAHPERSREHGYDYLRACLQHHLGVAGMLRIDHVMALHRLFWIPDGFPPTEGVYVRYPARELWAIVALESQRNQAVIVGEDLGTVPSAVRRAMRRNRAHRIFVVQTEVAEDRLPCLDPPAPDSIACMNTHDMPPFASYRLGGDLRDLNALGFLDDDTVGIESARRADKVRVLSEFLRHGGWLAPGNNDADEQSEAIDTLRACLRFMADSEAAALIVNLEDLWLEQLPQNVPGTSHERPNWRRRARYSLEEMKQMRGIAEIFEDIERRRLDADNRGSADE